MKLVSGKACTKLDLRALALFFLAPLDLTGCFTPGSTAEATAYDQDAAVDATPADLLADEDASVPPALEASTPVEGLQVYAHSAKTLFGVDPGTLEVSRVADFGWPDGAPDAMTDIAIDAAGRLVGISATRLYAIDRETAACTLIAPLSLGYNALTFVPAPDGQPERLLAAAMFTVFELDPLTGEATELGPLGGGLLSSGDLVSVDGLGTLATVTHIGRPTSLLARVDPGTGRATVVGDTGYGRVWGLGFWRDRIYGFTGNGQLVLLDPQAKTSTLVSSSGVAWWGAAVTTSAPVVR